MDLLRLRPRPPALLPRVDDLVAVERPDVPMHCLRPAAIVAAARRLRRRLPRRRAVRREVQPRPRRAARRVGRRRAPFRLRLRPRGGAGAPPVPAGRHPFHAPGEVPPRHARRLGRRRARLRVRQRRRTGEDPPGNARPRISACSSASPCRAGMRSMTCRASSAPRWTRPPPCCAPRARTRHGSACPFMSARNAWTRWPGATPWRSPAWRSASPAFASTSSTWAAASRSPIPDMAPPPLGAFFAEIEASFEALGLPEGTRLWAEPGRALVAGGVSVVVQVLLRRGDALYVNDGIYGSLSDAGVPGFRFPSRLVRPDGRRAVAGAARLHRVRPDLRFGRPAARAGAAAGRHGRGRLDRDRPARRLRRLPAHRRSTASTRSAAWRCAMRRCCERKEGRPGLCPDAPGVSGPLDPATEADCYERGEAVHRFTASPPSHNNCLKVMGSKGPLPLAGPGQSPGLPCLPRSQHRHATTRQQTETGREQRADLPRSIVLEGASNLRDLGGWRTAAGGRVRFGQVFRSASLGRLTEADAATLAATGLRSVVDLRGEGERRHAPSRLACPARGGGASAADRPLARRLAARPRRRDARPPARTRWR